jgi:ATP-dependent helicase/nuclease subunit A
MKREDVAEELRILYVAFTRAVDRLVLLGTSKNIKDGVLQTGKAKNSYLDYLSQVIDEGSMELFLHDRSDVHVDLRERNKHKRELLALFDEPDLENLELVAEVDRRLSFTYPNAKALKMKSKYAVTELIGEAKKFEIAERLKVPAFDREEKQLTGAEKGTILHRMMEWIDFKDIVNAEDRLVYVREQVEEMVRRELLTLSEVAAVDLAKIVRFFDADLGRRAGASERVHKEIEFNMLQMLDETQVMVQGVIDCYFEEKDGLVLIDYKSNYVNPKNETAAINEIKRYYRGQIQIYKDALKAAGKKPVKAAYLYLFSIDKSVEM